MNDTYHAVPWPGRNRLTSGKRLVVTLLAALSISLAGLLATAPTAWAHSASIQVSCSAATFTFSGFPAVNGNTVSETVTADGATVYSNSFTFNGPAAINAVTINLPSGSHVVNASANWNTNGVSGSASSGDTPLSCPGQPTCPQNSISGNFNGNAVMAGDYIWFNSVVKVKGVPPAGGHVFLTNVHVNFVANGTPYTVDIPGGQIYLSPSVTTATTYFSKGQEWITNVPAAFGDNIFLSGVGWQVPSPGLPGGIKDVTWAGDFSLSPGMSLNWQWAAAVYTQFVPEPPLGSDEATNSYTTLDVKVVHSTSLDSYHNGDQAGTPENRTNPFIPNPINGATGGGASNFTGSYSSTGSCP
jgi:hypothetical protein